jgi:DNA-binding transcriptional MerR regulator
MLGTVDTLLGIGEFSKMTYLSVKALRHYHDVGLLEPALIDPSSGYRHYSADQVAMAQAIRRFRDLDMPIEEVRRVLDAPDVASRNRTILAHLERMQQQLEQTQATVASLQSLLGGAPHRLGSVAIRRLPATPVVTASTVLPFDGGDAWLEPTFADLRATAAAAGLVVTGPDGALYSDEFFHQGVGEVTAFVPVGGRPDGDDIVTELPATTVAVLVHEGPFTDLDQAYGALGTVVAERGIGGPGPIREHYLAPTSTEVCWPVTTGANP